MSSISPFQRTRDLLSNINGKDDWIDLSIGAPRHDTPEIIREVLNSNFDKYRHYPSANTSDHFGKNLSEWIRNRFQLITDDITNNILPISGSREGIFFGSLLATKLKSEKSTFILPDPFYPVYATAGQYTSKRILAVSVHEAGNYLINLEEISNEVWSNTIAFYLCSPSNPQGTVADDQYLENLYELSLKYQFIIIADECYSEIYRTKAPNSILKISEKNNFENVLSFNSLSKRSNAPGLRSGYVMGDKNIISEFFNLRNVAAPTVPTPIQIASEALWADEEHVINNRKLYNEKFDTFYSTLDKKFNFQIPEGGFFAWLDISNYGTDESVTIKLWQSGVKVIPGSYLSLNSDMNPDSKKFIRIALVGSNDEISKAASIINKVIN
jgi:N-succinyldiaminopimelate aminotransferase